LFKENVSQELTYIIKQDIASINKQIAALQSYLKQRNSSKSAEGKQIDEHNHNVVMLLQSKLANTSMSFKDVLEVRTQVSVVPIGRKGLFFTNGYGRI
jgi:syntaxin 5